ncbi:MAG: MFS transporter [Candidatus Pacebacteria bacterium]|nr:MFS transporter [Candidatus Paceibacterota bacterium]
MGTTDWKKAVRESLPRNVVVLGVVSFLTDASSEMVMWTFPFFIALLGGGAVWVGVVEGLRESLASLLKLASGWFSDQVGKRKGLVVLGYGISTFVKPMLALAAVPWHVLALLGVERIGKGVRTAPRDALIAGVVSEEHRGKAFSFHRLMDHGGAVVGLLAGTGLVAFLFPYFRDLGDKQPIDVFRFMYILAAVPAALAVLAALIFVREKMVPTKRVKLSFRAGYDRRFWYFLGILVIFALGNSSDMFLILRAGEVLGYDIVLSDAQRAEMATSWQFPWQLPLMFLALSFAKGLFSMPGGILADRIGRARTLGLGWAVYAVVYLLFGFATHAWHVWGLFLAYGLFYGFTEGVEKAVVADFVRPEVRGSAYGLYAFADGIAKFPASLLLGILYQAFGAGVAFCFGGLCAALACIFLFVLVGGSPKP